MGAAAFSAAAYVTLLDGIATVTSLANILLKHYRCDKTVSLMTMRLQTN